MKNHCKKVWIILADWHAMKVRQWIALSNLALFTVCHRHVQADATIPVGIIALCTEVVKHAVLTFKSLNVTLSKGMIPWQ
jgi:hypothetical protein